MSTKDSKLLPILMWSTATLFYFYIFFLQVSPSVITKNLMEAFSINAAKLGVLASVYFYAYASLQIPVGVMLDRFGARRLLTIAALICALGTIIFGTANGLFIASVGRLLVGFGSAFATISCLYIASIWLPTKWFSLLTGLMLAIGVTGAISGQAPLSILVTKFHWRYSMYILAAAGLIIALLLWLIVRDKKRPSDKSLAKTEHRLLNGLKEVIRNRQMWLCSIYAGLMYTPTLVFGTLWGIPFLAAKYHIGKHLAATISSTLFFGWLLGCPIFGWLSDHFKKRKPFLIIASIGTLACSIITLYTPAFFGYFIIGIAIFCFGFFSSGMPLCFSIAREINSPTATGAAMGVINAVNMLGGAIVPPLVGTILDLFQPQNGATTFTTTGYEIALAILPIVVFISLLLLTKLKESI